MSVFWLQNDGNCVPHVFLRFRVARIFVEIYFVYKYFELELYLYIHVARRWRQKDNYLQTNH